MRRLPASPAFARQQRARQDQPVVLGEALAGAGFDDREPLPEVIEGSPGPLLRPQAAQAEIKTRKMGFGAAAGAQMEAGQERREPGLALDWLFGLPGVGQQKRAEEGVTARFAQNRTLSKTTRDFICFHKRTFGHELS